MQKDTLKRLSEAFSILEKYGKNLLRPSGNRPPVWRCVMFANGVFSEKVDWMVVCTLSILSFIKSDDL